MHDVTDHDRALIVRENSSACRSYRRSLRRTPARCRRIPRSRPTHGSAVEYDFAEYGEQNLRRAAARGPADADHQEPEDQRHGTDVAQSLDIFVPGRTTSASVNAWRRGTESAGR